MHGATGWLPGALSVVVIVSAAIVAWCIVVPGDMASEPGRTYALWRASEAVAAYASPRTAETSGEDASNLARKFAQAIVLSRQVASIGQAPALQALAHRLETERRKLIASPGRASEPPDDIAELTGLIEAANRENAGFVERGAETADWLRLSLVGLIGVGRRGRTAGDRRAGAQADGELAILRHRLDESDGPIERREGSRPSGSAAKTRFPRAPRHMICVSRWLP